MSWIEDLKNAFKLRTVIIALGAFALGQIAFQFLILRPNRILAEELESKLEDMTDTYIQLKATDMNKLVDQLDYEVKFIENTAKTALSDALPREQLPFFISKLESGAEKVGLRVTTSVHRSDKPKKDEPSIATITLSLQGAYGEVIAFIGELQKLQTMVIVKNFSIQNRNADDGTVSANVQLVAIITES